jgi:hypothetical protein
MHRLEFLFGDAPTNLVGTYRVCMTLGDGTERVFVGSNTHHVEAVAALMARAVHEATAAAGPAGPAALLKALIEELGQQPVSATTSA